MALLIGALLAALSIAIVAYPFLKTRSRVPPEDPEGVGPLGQSRSECQMGRAEPPPPGPDAP